MPSAAPSGLLVCPAILKSAPRAGSCSECFWWKEAAPPGRSDLGGALNHHPQFISPHSRTGPQNSPGFGGSRREAQGQGRPYLMMLHSGSIRTMVGSSTYWKNRSWWILALSTCTITFISSTSSEDVVLHTM